MGGGDGGAARWQAPYGFDREIAAGIRARAQGVATHLYDSILNGSPGGRSDGAVKVEHWIAAD